MTRNSVFVDTGAYLALFHHQDQRHSAAVGAVERVARQHRVTTSLVIAEGARLVPGHATA